MRSFMLSTVLLAALAAGCAPASAAKGVVFGGIRPCQGVIFPGGPQFAAGTVTVLRGWAHVVASAKVGVNDLYQFQLDPGAYVLQAHYATGEVQPYIPIVVAAGATTRVDIPNECI